MTATQNGKTPPPPDTEIQGRTTYRKSQSRERKPSSFGLGRYCIVLFLSAGAWFVADVIFLPAYSSRYVLASAIVPLFIGAIGWWQAGRSGSFPNWFGYQFVIFASNAGGKALWILMGGKL